MAAVLALLMASVAAWTVGLAAPASASGASTPSLIGWTAHADANTVDIVVDNAGGLGGAHPLSEIDIPEDFSDFETGPFGYGLASIVWPGAVAGNLGSLTTELGLPSSFAPYAADLNDPVKAESYYPAGPASANYPSGSPTGILEMESHSDGTGSWAKAGLSDLDLPGLLDLQGLQGSTTAGATNVATSSALGSFHTLSLLGGLLQIGATSSNASAESDGQRPPSGTSVTHLGAITVAGLAASVGSDGLIVGPASTNLLGVLLSPVLSLVNQVISDFDIKVALLPQTSIVSGTTEQVTSEGLQISFALPSSASLSIDCNTLPAQLYAALNTVCHLPDEVDGLKVSITIGRVIASAFASPSFSLGSGPQSSGLPSSGSPGSTNLAVAGNSSVGATPPASGLVGSAPLAGSSPLVGASSPGGRGSPPSNTGPGSLIPIALSTPVKAGLLGFLLVIAAIVALGLSRMGRTLEAPPPTACTLEEGQN